MISEFYQNFVQSQQYSYQNDVNNLYLFSDF